MIFNQVVYTERGPANKYFPKALYSLEVALIPCDFKTTTLKPRNTE